MFSVSEQAFIFLSCIAAGICCGVLYDIGKAIRTSFRLKQVFTFLIDLLFWIVGAFLFFGFIYFSGNGQLRFFSVLGLLLGFVFYMVAISKWFLTVLCSVLDLLYRIICKGIWIFFKIATGLLWPGKKIWCILDRCLRKIKMRIRIKFQKKDLQKKKKWYMIKEMKKKLCKRDSNEKEN